MLSLRSLKTSFGRANRRESRRPQLEQLETRFVPSTLIVNQPWDGKQLAGIAQVFTDLQKASAFEYDDFTTTAAYNINIMHVPGDEFGSSKQNIRVVGQIWTGLPDKGGTLVMTGNGLELANGSLDINFQSQPLQAGSYWITAFVVRPFLTGGQWFWFRTTPINGSEEFFYNPGGYFGLGTNSVPGSEEFGSSADMAFSLHGTPIGDSPHGLGVALQQTNVDHAHMGSTWTSQTVEGQVGGANWALLWAQQQQEQNS
jgi:hypothetical protein